MYKTMLPAKLHLSYDMSVRVAINPAFYQMVWLLSSPSFVQLYLMLGTHLSSFLKICQAMLKNFTT